DAADVVHEEAIVPYGPAGLHHGGEDVAVLLAERGVGRGVVARPGQHVGGTTGKARGGGGVVLRSGRAGGGIALGDRAEIHRHVAVRALGFVRQAPVDEGVVDLLGESFRVGDATLQAP